ncbi:MAG: hypothetical protein WD044_12955 [Dongiaceae bacterium]
MRKQVMFGAAMLLAMAAAGAPALADGEKELGPDAILLTGDDLATALTDVKVQGWAFDGSDWFYFTEHYMADGNIVGVGGPVEGSSKWQWSGNWRNRGRAGLLRLSRSRQRRVPGDLSRARCLQERRRRRGSRALAADAITIRSEYRRGARIG